MQSIPPREAPAVCKKGDACFIAGTKEFFIALQSHEEWGTAFIVFGAVQGDPGSWATISRIHTEPYTTRKDPAYNFTTRWLEERIAFQIYYEEF